MSSGNKNKMAPSASSATMAAEAKKRKRQAEEATKKTSTKQIEEDENDDDKVLAVMPVRSSWAPVPTADECAQHGWVKWSPKPLAGDFKRCVVGLPSASLDDAIWPASVAAVNVFTAAQDKKSNADNQMHVVIVVCETLVTASTIAWVARCRGISCSFAFSTTDEDMKKAPEEHFNNSSLILVSSAVIRHQADQATKKKSANLSQWVDGRTVVVMPDVTGDQSEFQTISSRAVFMTLNKEESSAASKKKKKESSGDELEATHQVSGFGKGSSLTPVVIEDIKTVLTPRTDNLLESMLARGELLAFIERVIEIFRVSRVRCEDVLQNALVADWGCTSDLVAHHKLAYVLRRLAVVSKDQEKQNCELHTIAIRCVAKCVRMLPPISAGTAKKIGDNLPNLTLQATLCTMYPLTSPHVIDCLGKGWGCTAVIAGPKALEGFDKKRSEQVHRVDVRYSARIGHAYSQFLTILLHLVTNATALWAMAEDEVDYLTQWGTVLSQDCGPLTTFLNDAMLLPESAGGKGLNGGVASPKGKASSASKKEEGSRLIRPQKGLGSKTVGEKTGVKVNSQITSLPTERLPLVGTRRRQKEVLWRMAVEEILSAMPKNPLPMYIGDVGQLIGIWTKFNAKYDGALPVSLSEFLLANEADFGVIQNVVTRKKAGLTEQIKVRYDVHGDEEHDSEDDGQAGPGKKIHRKKKRREKLKEINAKHFDKNHKTFDQSSKVPGYIKPRPRAVKGRGNKKNIRRFTTGK